MKYIKKFEHNNYIGEFWLIKTADPYMEISLQKIGAAQSAIEDFFSYKGIDYVKKDSICYISMRYNIVNDKIHSLNTDKCTWMPVNYNSKNYYIKENLKYMGEIIVTDDDIKLYNIKNDIIKYNL